MFCLLLALLMLLSVTACQKVRYEYYSDDTQYEQEQDQNDDDDETGEEDMKDTDKTTKGTGGGKEDDTQKTEKTLKTRKPKTTAPPTKATTKPSQPVNYVRQSELLETVVQDGRALTLGRTAFKSGGLRLPQALSGVRFAGYLTGEMTVELNVGSNPGTYMTVVLDGNYDTAKTTWVASGAQTLKLADNLTKGYHTVEVLRSSTPGYAETQINRVAYTGQLEKPAYRDLQIEFIGDSITGGEGNWDDTTSKNTYSVKYCNSYETYAAKTARALNAEINVLATCGWRVDHAVSGFSGFGNPDIVVINLGTNVYGLSDDQVTANMHTLLQKVRQAYGADTYIVWAYGMMSVNKLALLKGEITELAKQDKKLLFCDMTSVQDQKGTQSHPSAAGHTAAATLLTKFLKDNCL
jgi:hypothetical protein